PLVVLAVGAVAAGILNPTVDGALARWLEPVAGVVPSGAAGLSAPSLGTIAAVLAVGTLAIAWLVYASGRVDWLALRARAGSVQRLFANGWYVDDAYAAALVAPGKAGAAFTAYELGARFVAGVVTWMGGGTRWPRGAAGRDRTG